jgi:hypothetical protein
MPEGPFDAFFIFSFLEHIPNIRDFLETVRGNLRERAVGLIEVPNFDMILRRNLFAEFIIDHLFYFTEQTAARTLDNNGFTVLSCAPVRHDYILSMEVRKREPVDLSALEDARIGTVEKFAAFFKRYDRVAVWGAGHQAFTMLAMLNDVSKIAYMVDSATFKQGRFSPVTHIPVLAPDALREDAVDGLIVMGGSYSEEIAAEAVRRYGQRNTVIFRDNDLVCFSGETA